MRAAGRSAAQTLWASSVHGPCPAGPFGEGLGSPEGRECEACESDCKSCADGSVGETCENSKFLVDGDCVESCKAGFYGVGTGGTVGRTCVACEAHCASCTDGNTCVTCADDRYLSNGDCVEECPVGRVAVGTGATGRVGCHVAVPDGGWGLARPGDTATVIEYARGGGVTLNFSSHEAWYCGRPEQLELCAPAPSEALGTLGGAATQALSALPPPPGPHSHTHSGVATCAQRGGAGEVRAPEQGAAAERAAAAAEQR